MASTALYRKYRSLRFDELIGQDHIATTLRNEVRDNHLAHGYLFAGIRGTGKTSTARILARAVNCPNVDAGEPCNQCNACREILDGSSVDVLEIDAASNRGIDEIRDLRDRVKYLPASLRRKVYIIDEAHMLTHDAWNAFLKTLEEPPDHVLFVLATTEPHKVPDTVRSRVQRFDFRRVTAEAIAAHLASVAERETVAVDADAVELLARAGQGSVRDALSLLDQALAGGERPVTLVTARRALGLADPDVIRRLLRAVARGEAAAALQALEEAFAGGAEARPVLQDLQRLARGSALLAVGYHEGQGGDHRDDVDAPIGFWVEALDLLASTEGALKQPVDSRLLVEHCILRLAVTRQQEDLLGDLRRRVERLEMGASVTAPAPPVASPAAVPEAPAPVPVPVPVTPEAGEPAGALPSEAVVAPPPVDATAAAGAEEVLAVAGGDAPDLARWIELWPKLVETVGRREIPLGAVVRDCEPIEAGPAALVIGARYKFHFDRLTDAGKLDVLSAAATAVAGCAIRVTARHAAQPEAAAERPPGGQSEAARRAMETFPGSRMTASRLRDVSLDGRG